MTQNQSIPEIVAELPEEEQGGMLESLGDLVFKESLMRAVEAMDEPTKKEFEALLERDASEDEVIAFLDKRVPNAAALVDEAAKEITGDILSGNP